MSSHLPGFLSGCFKQGPADSMTAVIPGNMETVNDEPAFVQPGNQHDSANHAVSFISAICHVPPAENLFSFFDKTRSIPILSEGIVNQCQIPILQAIHVFYFLIPLKVFQRIPGEVMTVNKLYFQSFMPFIVKKIKRYLGKPILATDPNFSISSGFFAENFRRWHSSTEERQRRSVMKTLHTSSANRLNFFSP